MENISTYIKITYKENIIWFTVNARKLLVFQQIAESSFYRMFRNNLLRFANVAGYHVL